MFPLSTVFWIAAIVAVAAVSFVAGVGFGQGFWRDVAWMKTRR